MDVILSICIATFNRAAYIAETLESILAQAIPGVELVVVDGASTDQTAEILRGYAAKYPCIKYYRETANSGIDGDYDKAIAYARGKYCWFFSDDDRLKPDAVAIVAAHCSQEYAAVLVNADVWTANFGRKLDASRLGLTKDKIYSPKDLQLFFTENIDYLTFIGGLVIHRSLWLERNSRQYYGSYFVHVGVLFQKALPCDVLVVARPLIEIRYGNASWTAKYFDIWMFKWPNLLWSLDSIKENTRCRVARKTPWKSCNRLLLFRALGAFNYAAYKHMPMECRTQVIDLARLWVFLAIPGWLINLVACIYTFFFVKKKALLFVDLYNSPYFIFRRSRIKS